MMQDQVQGRTQSKNERAKPKQDLLTIGRLARAAEVGVETIRYYQRRALLPTPDAGSTAFRSYPSALVDRIRFIKRSQELGFTLEQVGNLLQLEDGNNRPAIRELAGDKLSQIREKIADLQKMERVLSHLLHECEATGQTAPCPIIAALTGQVGAAGCH
jgi:MerR family mercuric resistance operon transcriptional regulator